MLVGDHQLRVPGEACRGALCGVSCSRSVVMFEVSDVANLRLLAFRPLRNIKWLVGAWAASDY